MDNILVQYLDRKAVREDSEYAYNQQIKKIQNAYENGQIGVFGALVCVVVLSFLCFFLCIFYQIKYTVAKIMYQATNPSREPLHYWTEMEKVRLEVLNNLKDYNSEVSKAVRYEAPKKLTQGECAAYLRKVLMDNGNILNGTIVRTTFPKISGEELLEATVTGVSKKPFIVQRVTFGNEINKALKILYPKLKNRKVKGQDETYIVFEGDEVFELEKELRGLFMKPVTINLRAN